MRQMTAFHIRDTWFRVLLGAAVVAVLQTIARGDKPIQGVIGIWTKASPDYVRERLPDGSFRPEEYAFWEGGPIGGAYRDPSIDKLNFRDVGQALVRPLGERHYVPAKSPGSQKLLIVVYWGTTIASKTVEEMTRTDHSVNPQGGSRFALDEIQRRMQNFRNANLIGYQDALKTVYDAFPMGSGTRGFLNDQLLIEIEEGRYFLHNGYNATYVRHGECQCSRQPRHTHRQYRTGIYRSKSPQRTEQCSGRL